MKVLFVYVDLQAERNRKGQLICTPGGWFQEGIASIAACLRQAGHETALYHMVSPVGRDEFVRAIRRQAPDVVGFSIHSAIFPMSTRYARWAKEAGVPLTVAGGVHAMMMPEQTLAGGFDIACIGEGERPMVELCERLHRGEDITSISSLHVRTDNGVVANPTAPFIEDLDEIPYPYFELFDFRRLVSSETYTGLARVSRGCPYSCTYCCNRQIRALYPNPRSFARTRSPAGAIGYLKALRQAYPQMRYLNFMDDILHPDEAWLEEFVPMYKREIGLPFVAQHRPGLLTERAAFLLRDAGCYELHFGVESGNEEMRRKILRRGNISNEQIIEAFRLCKKYDIATGAYNMIGLPFETMPMVLETIKLNAIIAPNRVWNPIFTPYPQTELHRMAVEAGLVAEQPDYETEVIVDNPGFRPQQVLFVRSYFKPFVDAYKLARRLPRLLGWPLEIVLDRIFLFPFLPYGLLTRLGEGWTNFQAGVKSVVRRRFPWLYLRLRDWLTGKKIARPTQ
ncbi:MAG: B12-binding domain-containing radical SAM protein [Dehalococcoidia bacterium]